MAPSKLKLRIQNMPIKGSLQQDEVIVYRTGRHDFKVTNTSRLTDDGGYRYAQASSPSEAARLVREMA
jgi:hypothetical protein